MVCLCFNHLILCSIIGLSRVCGIYLASSQYHSITDRLTNALLFLNLGQRRPKRFTWLAPSITGPRARTSTELETHSKRGLNCPRLQKRYTIRCVLGDLINFVHFPFFSIAPSILFSISSCCTASWAWSGHFLLHRPIEMGLRQFIPSWDADFSS